MNKCSFESNTINCSIVSPINIYGGLIYLKSSPFTFNDCMFSKNNIFLSSNETISLSGGIAHFISSDGNFSACTFNKNEIYSCSNKTVTINGGALCLKSSINKFLLCNFVNSNIISNANIFEIYGGFVYTQSSNETLIYCLFDNNTFDILENKYEVRIDGGSMFFQYSDYIFDRCNFSNNKFFKISNFTSYESFLVVGGEIKLHYSDGRFNQCTFTNKLVQFNTYREFHIYGLILNLLVVNTTFDECLFSNNSIFINISDTEYSDYNHDIFIMINGGLIKLYNSESYFNNCDFINNIVYAFKYIRSDFRGGAIYLDRSICSFTKCNFSNNILYSYSIISSDYYINENFVMGGMITLESSEGHFKLCNFEISINKYIKFDQGYGILIAVYSAKGIFEDCFFNSYDNYPDVCNEIYSVNGYITFYGISIFYDQVTPGIIIKQCTFKLKFTRNIDVKSIIYLNLGNINIITNQFLNNRIYVNNIHNTLVFDGSIVKKRSYWTFKNNCINPYKNNLFKSTNISLYNEANQSINFYQAFSDECFDETNLFTYSMSFNSDFFTLSKIFIQTGKFSKSEQFSNSIHFSQTNSFSKWDFFSDIQSDCTSFFSYSFKNQKVTKSFSFSLTFVSIKTVIFSMSYLDIAANFSYFPYIIYSLSPSYIPTYVSLILSTKKRISSENLIGISCGSAALFFIIVGITIFIYQKKQYQKYSNDVFLSSSDNEEINSQNKEVINGIGSNVDNNDFDNWL